MAKTLAERITSARSTDRVTITDLEALIVEARAERERLEGSSSHHAAESINLALSDDDREESDRLAHHFRRTAKAYGTEIGELEKELEKKRNSDRRLAAEAEQTAKIARRDDLAARMSDRLPALFAELTGFLAEIEASDAEIGPLPSAEAIARGVPANFYQGPTPIARLLTMKIPNWGGHSLAWPIDRSSQRFAELMERENRQRAAHKQELAKEAARWSRFMVKAPRGGEPIMITTKRGDQQIYRNTLEAVMTAEGVKDAEAKGCTVTPLASNESVGLPNAAAVLA